ncbi:hypothetical protein DNTS_034235, partial [Danionella cerebrum]
ADSNPPAKLSWFKRQSYSGSGTFLTVPNISLDDEEAYNCKALNKQGKNYSVPVRINVIYPPRNISVSISGSGEVKEGDSVTLSCSADSNPPATITWYKRGISIAAGQSFSISKIRSADSGEYRCSVFNSQGGENSN